MARALVLNATEEPIGVVSARRAIVLALSRKVDVVVDTGKQIASASICVPVPSVIRLRYYVKVPYQRTAPLSRRAVFARDHGECQYCGEPAESIDHVIPRSRNGPHSWDNVVACCRRCNSNKGDRLLKECSLNLKTQPKPPQRYMWVKVAAGSVPQSWEPYLNLAA